MPTLRCLNCGHEQAIDNPVGVRCAHCGTEFVRLPETSHGTVMSKAVLSALGWLFLIVGFAIYIYFQLRGIGP
jgi:hypothetical protein